MTVESGPDRSKFGELVARVEPPLRRALVAAYGHQVGREATAEALAWAWEHWNRLAGIDNPAGYLYRVGQTRARRLRRAASAGPIGQAQPATVRTPWVEPALHAALESLTENQRVAVVLCHGFQWTHREVGALLDITPSTVQNHVERGLEKLRVHLGEDRRERSS